MLNPLQDDLEFILRDMGDSWEELRGANLFITGGTGFFGCWLLASLFWANEKLNLNVSATVLTRNPQAFQSRLPDLASQPSLCIHKGDVRSFEFPKREYTHIIHAATEASVKLNREQPLLMLDTIVDGTRRTLEFARRCGATKFLMTSSGAVYGKQPPDLTHIPEDYAGAPDPLKPFSAYGGGKRQAESLCTLYAQKYGIEAKIARCFAFVGPYLPLDGEFAIGNFIRDGLQKRAIEVAGDGTPYRSYLYAADLVIWLWTILFRGKSCYAYNVGSENALTISDLAHEVARCFTPVSRVKIALTPTPGQGASRYVPSVRRCTGELSIHQTIDLHEAICRTRRWHLR